MTRNNIARWPRQYAGTKAGGKGPRDFARCDCSDAPKGGCYSHPCFATYAGGSEVQWVNDHCGGAFNIRSFNGDYPNPKETKWCGVRAVVGNTYSQMQGQANGCRLNTSTSTVCNNRPDPPGTVGGQCAKDEAQLPLPCDDRKVAAGFGGICYCNSGRGHVMCMTATELAENSHQGVCKGCANKCTIYS